MAESKKEGDITVPEGVSSTRETDFNDETIKGSEISFYKGVKGRTDLLEFPIIKIHVADVHYLESYFQCHRGECCTSLGEVSQRCGTVVFQFPTDKSGAPKMLTQGEKKIPYEPDVHAWVFNGDKYKSLKLANTQFPFKTHGLMVTCGEETYQRLNFQSTNARIFGMLEEDTQKKLLATADSLYKRIDRLLGHKISRAEMLARLSMEAEPSGDASPGQVIDLESLTNPTGGAAAQK